MKTTPTVPPPVAQALREGRRIVRRGDLAVLPPLLHPEVVFRSPAAAMPGKG